MTCAGTIKMDNTENLISMCTLGRTKLSKRENDKKKSEKLSEEKDGKKNASPSE